MSSKKGSDAMGKDATNFRALDVDSTEFRALDIAGEDVEGHVVRKLDDSTEFRALDVDSTEFRALDIAGDEDVEGHIVRTHPLTDDDSGVAPGDETSESSKLHRR